jgi:acyl-CoA reductase-like NAD-dependent aldehyde dehydrogenase
MTAVQTVDPGPALREAADGVLEASMTIAGERVGSHDAAVVINPARLDETVGRFPRGTCDHARDAVEAARAALPGWSSLPVADRAAMLTAAGDMLQRRVGAWQELLTRENGKVLLESGFDLQMGGAALEYYGRHPEFLADQVAADARGTLRVSKRPIGVCAAIVPWNWPLVLSALKIGPALLSGDTLVIKGPDHASMTFLAALGAVAELFPPGVLNVISGQGPELGRALVTDPAVAKVSLTGGVSTGRAVAVDAAAQLKRVTLELGGNDAAILLPDVELSEAVVGNLALGAFSSAGQICFAVKRLLVHRSRYRELLELLRVELEGWLVGDGLAAGVRMGPLNNHAQYERVRALLTEARRSGLTVEQQGELQPGLDPATGYFIRPQLVLDPPDSAQVVADEQFGPVLPVLVYDEVTEALARANATPFGLCSSIWTADEEAAFELSRELRAGTTFINGHTMFSLDFDAPFGGIDHSGHGRECGAAAVDDYTYLHAVTNRRV